jgi:hypothetical protein
MQEQPPQDVRYRVPFGLPDPGPPPRWWGYLGMVIASGVPFAAVIALIWLTASAGQRGLSLFKILDNYPLFFSLFLACVPLLFVVPVAAIALLKNVQWWVRPDAARLFGANRWRRRFWTALVIGVVSSALINVCVWTWLYVSCYGCIID